jgi:hypothetical protein
MEFKKYLKERLIIEELILLEDEVETKPLDKKFIIKLMNYLESLFPSYGDFDNSMSVELSKYVKGDIKDIRKLKKRIHEIILRLKHKLIRDTQTKVEKLTAEPKTQEGTKPTEKLTPKSVPSPMEILDRGYNG